MAMTTIEKTGIDAIRELVAPVEPGAAVYFGPATDPADDRREELLLRRRTAARELSQQGAPESLITTVVDWLGELPEYAAECAVFVSGERQLAMHPLPGVVPADLIRYTAPLPVGPLLRWHQRHPAHVRVLADRAGADLISFATGTLVGRPRTVEGPDDDIRRHFPGGGQLPRMRRRSEDSWLHNARAIADGIREELRCVDSRLVLLGGDPRICRMVTAELTQAPISPDVYGVDGTRHTGGPTQAEVDRALDTYVQRGTADQLHRVARLGGPHGRTVSGLTEVLAALAAGLVDTLLIGCEEDTRTAWFGPDLLGARLRPPVPRDGDRQGNAVDIAIRAALLTRADVRILTPAETALVPGGVIAIGRAH
jgi:hypothetical protein